MKKIDELFTKRQKAIAFFAFYLVFFIVLFIVINNRKQEKVIDVPKEEKIDNTLYFENVLKMNFKYEIEIIDNLEIKTFIGTKDKVDYSEYENKYFLDIFNINQLIKKSKVIEKIGNYGKYSLANRELDELLGTESDEGENIIEVNEEEKRLEIHIDLHEYLKKEIFTILLIYQEGETND